MNILQALNEGLEQTVAKRAEAAFQELRNDVVLLIRDSCGPCTDEDVQRLNEALEAFKPQVCQRVRSRFIQDAHRTLAGLPL